MRLRRKCSKAKEAVLAAEVVALGLKKENDLTLMYVYLKFYDISLNC
jgi:hypothetical protein